MYIQLVDKDNFHSPVLYIHDDVDEFKKFIDKYVEELKEWTKTTVYSGMPLSRFEPDCVMVDLLHKLAIYYDESSMFREKGRILGTLRIMNESDVSGEDIIRIRLN